MSHDHVGIPKFIQCGFSINGTVFVYNTIKEKKHIVQKAVQRIMNSLSKHYETSFLIFAIISAFNASYLYWSISFKTSSFDFEYEKLLTLGGSL